MSSEVLWYLSRGIIQERKGFQLFRLSAREYHLLQKHNSVLVTGRSGTGALPSLLTFKKIMKLTFQLSGKTTCALLRVSSPEITEERHKRIVSGLDDADEEEAEEGGALRCMFVAVNPRLCNEGKRFLENILEARHAEKKITPASSPMKGAIAAIQQTPALRPEFKTFDQFMRMLDRTLKKPFFPAAEKKGGDTPVKKLPTFQEATREERMKGDTQNGEGQEEEWILMTKWIPGEEEDEESFSIKKKDGREVDDKNSLFFEPEEFASTEASPVAKGKKGKKKARKGMAPGDSLYMFKVRYPRFAYELYPSIVRSLHMDDPPHPGVTYKNIMSFIKGSWESIQVHTHSLLLSGQMQL